MIFLVAASLAFFLEFILLSKKGKSTADKILSVWMFLIGAHLLFQFFESTGLILNYPFLEGLATPLPLLHAPLLYLYAKTLTNDEKKLSWWEFLHFLPALLVVVYMIPFFILSGPEKTLFVQQLDEQGSTFLTIVLYSYMVSGVTYITLSLLILRHHRRNLVLNFSNTDLITLNWLRYIIIGMIVIWTFVTVGYLLEDAMGYNISVIVDKLIFYSLSGLVLMMGYFGIKQTTIFTGQRHLVVHEEDLIIEKEELNPTRYKKSGLKSAQADDIQARLEMMMNEDKPYLNDDLSLKSLAEKLDIHPNYLSQVINERFQKNFYDFVNSARVEEFKSLIQKPESQNLTLLALAFDCGFSSKSSFNKFFKKSTGQTPSAFMNAQKS